MVTLHAAQNICNLCSSGYTCSRNKHGKLSLQSVEHDGRWKGRRRLIPLTTPAPYWFLSSRIRNWKGGDVFVLASMCPALVIFQSPRVGLLLTSGRYVLSNCVIACHRRSYVSCECYVPRKAKTCGAFKIKRRRWSLASDKTPNMINALNNEVCNA